MRKRELLHYNSVLIKCSCGCNEFIHSINKLGKPARFKNHHNSNNPETHAHWKGGRIINSQGYVLIYKPKHPFCTRDGYVREHRLVMEEHIGRYLEPNEIVHHKNGNIKDNRIENLELYKTNSSHFKNCHINQKRNRLGQFINLQ